MTLWLLELRLPPTVSKPASSAQLLPIRKVSIPFWLCQWAPIPSGLRKDGFKEFHQTGIAIDANSAVRADARLQVGGVHEEMTVSSECGSRGNYEYANGRGDREHEDGIPSAQRPKLHRLVGPATRGGAGDLRRVRSSTISPSGNLNAGSLSVSGQRETANGFMVNGGNVNEGVSQTTSIVPSLDSIEEFRIITNNFDAEYGNYSGGQVNAITKSGTNEFHGEAFEFLRNDALDARNFFSSTSAGRSNRTSSASTFGGPIVRKKIFFFIDYQGTRQTEGQVADVPVPSSADLTGNLADSASALTGTVNGGLTGTNALV